MGTWSQAAGLILILSPGFAHARSSGVAACPAPFDAAPIATANFQAIDFAVRKAVDAQVIAAKCMDSEKPEFEASQLPVASEAQLECFVRELIATKFPKLAPNPKAASAAEKKGIKWLLRKYEEPGYFLSTDIDSPLSNARNRSYVVNYNPSLFKTVPPPSAEAIVGILAHELVHIRDYFERSSLAIAWLFTRDTNTYERETDEEAMKLGFGQGIKAYRNWVYTQLNPAQLAEKKARYYAPEEIDQWEKENSPPLKP